MIAEGVKKTRDWDLTRKGMMWKDVKHKIKNPLMIGGLKCPEGLRNMDKKKGSKELKTGNWGSW